MLTIADVNFDYDNVNGVKLGCNNGTIQTAIITIVSASKTWKLRMFDVETSTCGCRNGCGPLCDRIPEVGAKFETFDDFENYLES